MTTLHGGLVGAVAPVRDPEHPPMVRATCMTNPDCPERAKPKVVPLPHLGEGVYLNPGSSGPTFVCGACTTGMPMDRSPVFYR